MQCILIIFKYAPHLLTPHSDPPSPVCDDHLVLGMGPSTGPWLTYQRQYFWRKIGSPSPKSHQLTIILQLGVGLMSPPDSALECWLVWTCVILWDLPQLLWASECSASVLSCPKDTVHPDAFWLLGLTVFTPSSTMSLCLSEGWEHSTETWSLHFDQL